VTAPDAPRPRGRTAWLVLGGFAAVVGVLFGVGWTLGALANETRTITREFDDDAITTVDVGSGSGEVLVVGDREPGTGIEVRTRLTDGLWDGRHSEEVVGDRLEIRADCPFFFSVRCDVRIEVHAPRTMDVVVKTDNGDAQVRRFDGSVQATSDNGDIRAEDLAGPVRFSTDNGDVVAGDLRSSTVDSETDNGDVALDFTDPPLDVLADSDNGDLLVRLPRDDVGYALVTETDHGTITTPIRTDPESERRITARSDNGDITIRYAP
jgi:DUF4097 and DUF4098 domain-containing protein YvlB